MNIYMYLINIRWIRLSRYTYFSAAIAIIAQQFLGCIACSIHMDQSRTSDGWTSTTRSSMALRFECVCTSLPFDGPSSWLSMFQWHEMISRNTRRSQADYRHARRSLVQLAKVQKSCGHSVIDCMLWNKFQRGFRFKICNRHFTRQSGMQHDCNCIGSVAHQVYII